MDPNTGKELWSCNGLGNLVYTSPLVADGIAVNMSGFHGPALAVKLGGTGDITRDRLWLQEKKNPQRIGSGVHVYMLEENGTPHRFEVKTGKEIWNAADRPGEGAWGSMVHGDGKLYVIDRKARRSSSPPATSTRCSPSTVWGNTPLRRSRSRGDLFIRTYDNGAKILVNSIAKCDGRNNAVADNSIHSLCSKLRIAPPIRDRFEGGGRHSP